MITTRINKFLLKDKNIGKSAVFWNAFSAMMNSFQTMVLLMIITRFGTAEDSAIFVMAYAIGNLMLNVGKFGIRQFQVTDIGEKYSFRNYLDSRKLSTLLMIVFTFLYVGYNILMQQYSLKKSIIVVLICTLKAIESYEDVYHGRMQQKGRLDVAGRILGIRLFLFIVGFALCYILSHNLIMSALINVIISLLLSIFLNYTALKELNITDKSISQKGVLSLLWECFPLCACMCMNMYIANAPKYIIDTAVSDDIQTCFNIVFMPVFIIALLANFIFQPCLKNLGELWAEKKYKKFIKNIYVLAAVVILACAVITVVGAFIGGDILGLIYKVDLSSYNNLLIIFMISGGIIALQNLYIIAITVVRYQKYMIYGYITISIIILLAGSHILSASGIVLLSLFYLMTMILLLLYCMILLAIAQKKVKQNKNR